MGVQALRRVEYIARATIIPALFLAGAIGAGFESSEPVQRRLIPVALFLLCAIFAIAWYVWAWKHGKVKRGFFPLKGNMVQGPRTIPMSLPLKSSRAAVNRGRWFCAVCFAATLSILSFGIAARLQVSFAQIAFRDLGWTADNQTLGLLCIFLSGDAFLFVCLTFALRAFTPATFD